jgi:hypothetical protein
MSRRGPVPNVVSVSQMVRPTLNILSPADVDMPIEEPRYRREIFSTICNPGSARMVLSLSCSMSDFIGVSERSRLSRE